jgi:hypothetical protein
LENAATDDPLLDPAWHERITEARLGAWDIEGWRNALADRPDDEAGRNPASNPFVERLEIEAGRRLRVWKRGRPSIQQPASAEVQSALFE